VRGIKIRLSIPYSLFFISLYLFKKKRKFEEENYLTALTPLGARA